MNCVLVSGASGFIGKAICLELEKQNFEVYKLSRKKREGYTYWNPDKKIIDISEKKLKNITHIINLAGEGIADKRWTKKRKQEIIYSRITPINFLFETFKKINSKNLKCFISASAIGFYGAITSKKTFKENDKNHNDFLGKCCLKWENSSNKFSEICKKVVIFRLGVVFDKKTGALKKMTTPIKLGITSPLGKGTQFIPWIYISDLVSLFLFSIKNKNINGVYNAVSCSNTNIEITKHIAKEYNKNYILPNVPEFIIKLIFGKMSGILLKGSKVSNKKILDIGFSFKYDNIEKIIV